MGQIYHSNFQRVCNRCSEYDLFNDKDKQGEHGRNAEKRKYLKLQRDVKAKNFYIPFLVYFFCEYCYMKYNVLLIVPETIATVLLFRN